jgi:hypothetical protein
MGIEIDELIVNMNYTLVEIQSETDSAFKIFSDLTGFVANWIQIGTAIIPAIVNYINNTPSDAQLIEDLSNQVADVLSDLGVVEGQFLMFSLKPPWISVNGDLETLGAEYPVYEDVDPKTYFKDSNDFLGYVTDDAYWYRAFLSDRTFYPDFLSIYAYPTSNFSPCPGWYGDLPQPSSTPPQNQIISREELALLPLTPLNNDLYMGYTTVFDPQITLAAYLKAVSAFLTINMLLKGDQYGMFIAQWTQNLIKLANDLEARYDLLVAGLVKSDEPSAEDVLSYIAMFTQLGDYVALSPRYPNSLYFEPAGPLPPSGGHLNPPTTGFAWNSVYGVVDIFGVYTQPVPVPSRSPWHFVEVFSAPDLGVPPPSIPVDPLVAIQPEPIPTAIWLFDRVIPWVIHRVRLGCVARWKCIYLLRGYDKAWSVLQSLRVITKQQSMPFRDVNKDWSLREICSAVDAPLRSPLWYYPDGTYFSGIVLSDLYQDLWDIANSTWEQTWPTSRNGPFAVGVGGVRGSLRNVLAAACK